MGRAATATAHVAATSSEHELASLDAVERRRLQLWLTMSVVVVAIAGMVVILTFRQVESPAPEWLTPNVLRAAVLALALAFCGYAIEKEMYLRRLTRMLVEERVLTAALSSSLREVSGLHTASRAMNSVLELDQVLSVILDSAIELLDGSAGSVMLAEGDVLRVASVRGNEAATGAIVRLGESIAGRAAVERDGLLIEGTVDPEWFPGYPGRTLEVDTAMCVPLIHRDDVLGVLNIAGDNPRRFTEYDLRALSLFAEQAAGAIANSRMYEAQLVANEELAYRALHDPLTALPNRTSFLDQAGRAVARAARHGSHVAVLFVDLDNFKTINDSMGHACGDELLVAVADRLRREIRLEDAVARLGGDEFAVLVEDLGTIEGAEDVARRILSGLQAPFLIAGRDVYVTASVGVAADCTTNDDVQDLLRNADVAMYAAKADGKNRLATFEPEMHEVLIERLRVEADLQRAVRDGELELHFQPIVHLQTRRVAGMEGLVRWRHPTRGMVPPDQFIPIAEMTGIIDTIGVFVLNEACRAAAAWQHLPGGRDVTVSVNLSPHELVRPGIQARVEAALRDSGLSAGLLVLEITESTLTRLTGEVRAEVEALRSRGVRMAVDDFGTGYSALGYLHQLPLDEVKIDRSFIDGCDSDVGHTVVVKAIVRLSRELHLHTVAEGVEHEGQVQELLAMGCQHAQGFLFSPAVPFQEIPALLSSFSDHSVRAAG